MSATWSWSDYEELRNNYSEIGIAVTGNMNSKQVNQVLNKAIRMNVAYNLQFTQEEIDLCNKYGKALGSCMQFILPHRSPTEIRNLMVCAKEQA